MLGVLVSSTRLSVIAPLLKITLVFGFYLKVELGQQDIAVPLAQFH